MENMDNSIIAGNRTPKVSTDIAGDLTRNLARKMAGKEWVDSVTLDKLGMVLSLVCLIHCFLTPVVLISLPILARYYLAHPFFHLILAILIVPIGAAAFFVGHRHHHRSMVFWLGIPGLVIIAGVPYLVHQLNWPLNEALIMMFGSIMLVAAHWINRRACRSCARHQH